jgi:hypothetical protein
MIKMSENNKMVEYKENNSISEWGISKEMAKSYFASAFKPKNLKLEDAMMIMETGREMGIGRMYAMQSLYSISGKIGMKAEFMLARFNTLYPTGRMHFLQRDENACILNIKKHLEDEWETFKYTMEYAKTTPEYKRNFENYEKRARQMLHARCVSEAIRSIAPEVNMGLYTPEELEFFDIKTEPQPQPTPTKKSTNNIPSVEYDIVPEKPIMKEIPRKSAPILEEEPDIVDYEDVEDDSLDEDVIDAQLWAYKVLTIDHFNNLKKDKYDKEDVMLVVKRDYQAVGKSIKYTTPKDHDILIGGSIVYDITGNNTYSIIGLPSFIFKNIEKNNPDAYIDKIKPYIISRDNFLNVKDKLGETNTFKEGFDE